VHFIGYFWATAGPPNLAGPRVAYPLYPTLSTGLVDLSLKVCMYIHLLAMVTIHAKHCNITETITKGMDGHNDTYSHP